MVGVYVRFELVLVKSTSFFGRFYLKKETFRKYFSFENLEVNSNLEIFKKKTNKKETMNDTINKDV